jgi:hypothetical protein
MSLLLSLVACVGGEGAFQLSTGAVDLGLLDTTVTTEISYTVELQNAGGGTLDVIAAEAIGADGVTVALAHELPLTLASGEFTELTVTLTPTARGVGEATVRIYAADLESPSLDFALRLESLAPEAYIEGDTSLAYAANCGHGWDGTVTNRGDRSLVLEDLRGESAAGDAEIMGFQSGEVLGPGESTALAFDLPGDWYNDVDIELVLTTNDIFVPESLHTIAAVCDSDWVGFVYRQVSGSVDLMLVADHSADSGIAPYVSQLRSEMGAIIDRLLASGLDVRLGMATNDQGALAWVDLTGDSETLAAQVDGWFDIAEGSGRGFQSFEVAARVLEAHPEFQREESSLMVAILDEGDQPHPEGFTYYIERWSSPLDTWEHLRIHGLVPGESCSEVVGGTMLEEGVAATGGVAGGLCDSSYLPWVDDILAQHIEPERNIGMPQDPFLESLRVRMNSVLIPLDELDYQAPILTVGDAIEWGPGDYLDVKYVVDKQCQAVEDGGAPP